MPVPPGPVDGGMQPRHHDGMERRRFRVRIEASGEVVAYGYEFYLRLGRMKELPQGGWQAVTMGHRPLDSPVPQREAAVDLLVRHAGLRGPYDVDGE